MFDDSSCIDEENEQYLLQHKPLSKRSAPDPYKNPPPKRGPRQQQQQQHRQHSGAPRHARQQPSQPQQDPRHCQGEQQQQQQQHGDGWLDADMPPDMPPADHENAPGHEQLQQQQPQQSEAQHARQQLQQQQQQHAQQAYLDQQAAQHTAAAVAHANALHEEQLPSGRAAAQREAAQRQAQRHGAWRQQSPALALAALRLQASPRGVCCSKCSGSDALIRCWTCCPAGGPLPFCEDCDAAHHTHVHMHKREKYSVDCWQQQPFAAATAHFTIAPVCGGQGGSCPGDFDVLLPESTRPLWYITTRGVVKLRRASFRCKLCGSEAWQQPVDFLQAGAWPASLGNMKTVVQCELLQQWDSHRLCNPAATLTGFLAGVQHAAAVGSNQPALTISRAAFRQAHSEWKKHALDSRMHVGQLNDLECPACVPGERALHGDGNQKLFIWGRNREALRLPYYDGVLFAPPADVESDMRAVDAMLGRERVDNQCRGHWAAASNQARRREKQEITGRYFLTDARHGLPVSALNQIRTGERYSYALTLGLAAAAQQAGVRQLHIDIMCKWAPWLHRVLTKALQLQSSGQVQPQSSDVQRLSSRLAALTTRGQSLSDVRLVHSAAHGSLHAQSCQVLYQPSCVPDCCKTVGEAGEQLFSYLSPLGRTTCHQIIAGSTDSITEHSIEFARRKRAGQARFLVSRLLKWLALLPRAEARLQDCMGKLERHAPEQREAVVQQLLQALKVHAQADLAGSAPHKDLLELFSLAQRRLDAPLLATFLTSTPAVSSEGHQQQQQQQQPPAAGATPELEAVRMVASVSQPSTGKIHQLAKSVLQERNDSRYLELLHQVRMGLPSLAAVEHPTESQVIQALFSTAAEASILTLQNRIEAMCYNLGKIAKKRDATAARPKEQQRHSKKCSQLITQLGSLVQQYNMLLPYGSVRRTPADEQAVKQHVFAWADEYRHHAGTTASDDDLLRLYGMSVTLEVCDAYNEVQRIKEELKLLPREMKAHLQYWQAVVDKQDRLIAVLMTPPPRTAGDVAATVQQLQSSGFQGTVAGRYLPDCEALVLDERAREGAVCVLRLAQHESKWHLALAQVQFTPFLGSSGLDSAAGAAGATARAPSDPPTGAPGGPDAASDGDDDDQGYSDIEACEGTAFADAEVDNDSSSDGDSAGSDLY